MGLPVPTSVVSNSNLQVVQWLALIQGVGNELLRQYEWEWSTIEYRFTTQYLATTGTWTTSAATITGIPDTSTLAASTWMVVGNGIPQDTYISSVDSSSQVTLTQTPTAAGTAATVTFSQTKYTLPTDFDRPINNTDWDKSKRWQMLGPATAQQWQWLKSGWISTGPRIYYRILGDYFQIWPPQGISDYLGFEYVSKYWILATGGTAPTKLRFTVDTDTCVFPDRLMVAGLKKAYFAAKGYAPIYDNEYMTQLNLAKANDSGAPTLNMSGARNSPLLINQSNIPDSGYGS